MPRIPLIHRLFLIVGIVGGLFIATLLSLRLTGLLRPFKVPTSGMMPTLQEGDQFFMEGLTYKFRKPERHDILVFAVPNSSRTEETEAGPAPIYVQRVAGLPGDRLKLRSGELYINDEKDSLYEGRRFQVAAGMKYLEGFNPEIVVPADSYFVIGDNLSHSYDSRYWGFLPAKNIQGRVLLRYAPWRRFGFP